MKQLKDFYSEYLVPTTQIPPLTLCFMWSTTGASNYSSLCPGIDPFHF